MTWLEAFATLALFMLVSLIGMFFGMVVGWPFGVPEIAGVIGGLVFAVGWIAFGAYLAGTEENTG